MMWWSTAGPDIPGSDYRGRVTGTDEMDASSTEFSRRERDER